MRVIIVTIGSSGDVHPFVGIGRALRERGHDVTLITNGYFGPLVEKAGLKFEPLGDADEYLRLTNDPDLWHPTRGPLFVMRSAIVPPLRKSYELIESLYRPGETVLVGSSLAFGARVAQEKLRIPLATVHLAPSVIRSLEDPPVLPSIPLHRLWPRWMWRALYWIADRWIDWVVGRETNKVRGELGLAPARGFFHPWMHSTQLVIGLFPEWFCPRPSDWLPQIRLTGFPLFDERGVTALPAELESFLAGGDPPIVFTPGSAMRFGERFFVESAEACRRMGRRGILLTRFPEQVPRKLPAGVVHFDFVPFSQVLPRAAALVHHGGIGTSAQAMACATPQLVMNLSHDQFDNAARMKRLGVAESITANRYRAPEVARMLGDLIGSTTVRNATRNLAAKFDGTDPVGETCAMIESLRGTDGQTS